MTPEKIKMLSPDILQKIGLTTVFVGNIEFWTERTIWALSEEKVSGTRPSTDGKPISVLVEELADLSKTVSAVDYAKIIDLWVRAATPAFKCRNSILHGIMVDYEGALEFITNTQWEGEVRKRPSASFTANSHTLTLLNEVFEALLKSIIVIKEIAKKPSVLEKVITNNKLVSALQDARSTAVELSDLVSAINNEKY